MTPRTLTLTLTRAAIALVAVAAARTAAAEVVARAGQVDVTADQVRTYVETLGPKDQAELARDPALLSQVVRSLLARQAVLAEARTRRFDREPATTAQLDRVRDEALTELYLAKVSQPPEGYPSEAELEAAYRATPAAFAIPQQYRVAQIFVAATRGDAAGEEKARRRVDEAKRKLREKGADFAAVARAESEDRVSAARGGEIGWLSEAQMVEGIRRVVTGLPKGGVSDPVRLDDGWHLVKLLETRPPSTRALPEVRDALAAQLRAERARANRQAYLAKLLEQSPPVVNELALSTVLGGKK